MAVAAVEETPPSPPIINNIYEVMKNWTRGEMYKACMKRARPPNGTGETGETDAEFMSARMMDQAAGGNTWMVATRQLGEGAFGSVSAVEVPTLGVTLALKSFSAVRFLFRLSSHTVSTSSVSFFL